MEKILTTFTLKASPAKTVVRPSGGGDAALTMSQPQRADFFFRRNPGPTGRPVGDIMKGNPKVSSTKKRK
jgi:hypothetical protein